MNTVVPGIGNSRASEASGNYTITLVGSQLPAVTTQITITGNSTYSGYTEIDQGIVFIKSDTGFGAAGAAPATRWRWRPTAPWRSTRPWPHRRS